MVLLTPIISSSEVADASAESVAANATVTFLTESHCKIMIIEVIFYNKLISN